MLELGGSGSLDGFGAIRTGFVRLERSTLTILGGCRCRITFQKEVTADGLQCFFFLHWDLMLVLSSFAQMVSNK